MAESGLVLEAERSFQAVVMPLFEEAGVRRFAGLTHTIYQWLCAEVILVHAFSSLVLFWSVTSTRRAAFL
jgi:hypothetical protein